MGARSGRPIGRRWTCPDCRRQFGRRNQSHGCSPSTSVDAYFSKRPPVQHAIYDAIVAHLARVGPVLVDPVDVGIMLKRTRTFAEVRTKKNAVVLGLLLSRVVEHPRITRTIKTSANRAAHFVDLVRVEDLDGEVRAWLTEAFLDSPP